MTAGSGVDFTEALAERGVRAVPLSHLSVELGHLYFEDFAAGPDQLRGYFEGVARWFAAVREIYASATGGKRPRISTCFLVDDYFGPTQQPDEILPMLLTAADDAGLRIDYLARESACADADGVPLATVVEERIVADPPPGSNGSRPPVNETGWLCNGQRSPVTRATEAMQSVGWAPPAQNGTARHSVFVDVELWNKPASGRIWSCAYLAAIWQLLRLGALRYDGEPVAVPRPLEGGIPADWRQLPAVARLNPAAAPFCAYRAVSLLPRRFLLTEQAVRTILSQIALDRTVIEQTRSRAADEGIALPVEVADRVDYVFAGDTPAVAT